MIKPSFYGLLLALLFVSCSDKELSYYVDPFIGTSSHGHTYPGATTPFGLVQLSPDTGTEGWDWCSGYHDSDNSIIGFSHSHLSGTGGADLGDILFMPALGDVRFTSGTKDDPTSGYRSRFSHDSESAHAGYYAVYLDDPKVMVELTATPHVGIHRYTFDNPAKQHIMVDLTHGIQDITNSAEIRLVGHNAVEGFRRSNGWADDHTVYFYAQFDQPISEMQIMVDGTVVQADSASGKDVTAALFFDGTPKQITAKVGISYVDIQGAKMNMEKEAATKEFDELHTAAKEMWNEQLGKITVDGSDNAKTIFYTALYHSMLAPYGMSDIDGRYRGSDRQIHTDTTTVNYGLFSLWDTFRALHPLMNIVAPERNQEFVQSLIRYWEQSGRLPVWDLNMRETNCMIGYHAIPVIAESYMSGNRNFDANKALEAMIHSATQKSYAGLEYYMDFGYLPSDKENNSVSKALEYAYDDWCIAQMAKEMGRDSIYNIFVRRAQSYKNHFDPGDGFMKGRSSQGLLRTPFSPTDISILGQGDFTEGNSWHYSFFVPQDVNTHIDMLGGDEKYVAKLEDLFTSPSATADHSPDVSGLIGNYAHGNEPSHHVAYLYNYAGQPWRTQERISQIKREMYTTTRDGLCGNEDCGQMSAWYVFSAMGFYPVTPASGIYALGTPTFEHMTVNLENGKTFTINAENLNEENIYIQSIKWNDTPYTKSYITHDMIAGGGTLIFSMGNVPNKDFGSKTEDRPVTKITDSLLTATQMLDAIVFEPFLEEEVRTFNGQIEVTPKQALDQPIVYTLDGSEPTARSSKAGAKILINGNHTLNIRSIAPDGRASSVGSYKFYNGRIDSTQDSTQGGTLTGTTPAPPYDKAGLQALIDGKMGGDSYRNPQWVGYVGTDAQFSIKFKEPRIISGVGFNTLNEPGAWIILPFGATAKFYNGPTQVSEQQFTIPQSNQTNNGAHYLTTTARVTADHVELILHGGVLPPWHTSKGNGAWMFVDEITIF